MNQEESSSEILDERNQEEEDINITSSYIASIDDGEFATADSSIKALPLSNNEEERVGANAKRILISDESVETGIFSNLVVESSSDGDQYSKPTEDQKFTYSLKNELRFDCLVGVERIHPLDGPPLPLTIAYGEDSIGHGFIRLYRPDAHRGSRDERQKKQKSRVTVEKQKGKRERPTSLPPKPKERNDEPQKSSITSRRRGSGGAIMSNPTYGRRPYQRSSSDSHLSTLSSDTSSTSLIAASVSTEETIISEPEKSAVRSDKSADDYVDGKPKYSLKHALHMDCLVGVERSASELLDAGDEDDIQDGIIFLSRKEPSNSKSPGKQRKSLTQKQESSTDRQRDHRLSRALDKADIDHPPFSILTVGRHRQKPIERGSLIDYLAGGDRFAQSMHHYITGDERLKQQRPMQKSLQDLAEDLNSQQYGLVPRPNTNFNDKLPVHSRREDTIFPTRRNSIEGYLDSLSTHTMDNVSTHTMDNRSIHTTDNVSTHTADNRSVHTADNVSAYTTENLSTHTKVDSVVSEYASVASSSSSSSGKPSFAEGSLENETGQVAYSEQQSLTSSSSSNFGSSESSEKSSLSGTRKEETTIIDRAEDTIQSLPQAEKKKYSLKDKLHLDCLVGVSKVEPIQIPTEEVHDDSDEKLLEGLVQLPRQENVRALPEELKRLDNAYEEKQRLKKSKQKSKQKFQMPVDQIPVIEEGEEEEEEKVSEPLTETEPVVPIEPKYSIKTSLHLDCLVGVQRLDHDSPSLNVDDDDIMQGFVRGYRTAIPFRTSKACSRSFLTFDGTKAGRINAQDMEESYYDYYHPDESVASTIDKWIQRVDEEGESRCSSSLSQATPILVPPLPRPHFRTVYVAYDPSPAA